MKQCTLCGMAASVYCETGRVDLCWPCETKLHCSNILMEMHYRSLLCAACKAPTPWRGTGRRLCMAVAVCDRCRGIPDVQVVDDGNDEEDEEEEEEEEDYDDDEDDLGVTSDEMEDVDEGNQVQAVSSGVATPPPRASSCSGSDEDSPLRKGIRDHMVLMPKDNADPASSQDVARHSSSTYLRNAPSSAPPSGSLTPSFVGGPFVPAGVQREVPPSLPTLSQLNSRDDYY